jgi:hypothetical protein
VTIADSYSDGLNRLQAFGSSLNNHDPLGLFFSLGGIGTAMSMADGVQSVYNDQTQEAAFASFRTITDEFASAAFDQYLDYFWAFDWESPDDLYRGSASWASGTGSWAIAAPESADVGGPVSAGVVRPPGTDGMLGRAIADARSTATGLGVYFVYSDDGSEIIYAGRSKDLQTRMATQARRFSGEIVGFAMDSPNAVRALEQLGIEHAKALAEKAGRTSENVINGISHSNRKAQGYWDALATAFKLLK